MTTGPLRAAALTIAIAAVIDPAITTPRRVRAEVSVVAADSARDRPLAERIARTLRDEYRVLRAPSSAAAATVMIGDPPSDAGLGAPVFVIAPDRGEDVTFESVRLPDHAPLRAATRIDARVRARGPVEVALSADGVTVDRAAADSSGAVRLTWVPAREGAVPVRLIAGVDGEARAAADAVIDVRDDRWAVLFHDTRPSWQSTFVRRALEADPRFDVAMRVVTSRAASIAAGGPPPSLRDPAALARFDAIVVGAPEGLDVADVAALEHYLRRRGGRVVLLFDNDAAGAYDRLTGIAAWSTATTVPAAPIVAEGPDTLRASELRWPRTLPPGAAAVARDAAGRPVLWEASVGAGRILVNGALDSWRLRDPTQSGFDAFWRARIADAAAGAPPALLARLAQPVLGPGGKTTLLIAVRDLVLADSRPGDPLHASVSAALESANARQPLRVYPSDQPGRFEAAIRAPDAPGLYTVRVNSGSAEARAMVRVVPDPAHAEPDRGAILSDWAASRGGAVIAESDAADLPALLAWAVSPPRRPETWHPMRSPWWIVPFVLLLGGEWWWRRRRGLA